MTGRGGGGWDRDGAKTRRFRADELGPDATAREAEIVAEVVRSLEAAADVPTVRPSPGFSERVMAAIASEPAPGRTGFLAPLRLRGPVAGFLDSLRLAWRFVQGANRPVAARGMALAYVLVVLIAGASVTGVAAYGAAGAMGLLGPQATQPAPTTLPSDLPESPGPQTSPLPSDLETGPGPEPEPSESEEPGESAEPPDDHGGGGTPEESDDHVDGTDQPSPTSSDDDSSEPSDTPRPTGTPKPSQTPNSSDDSSRED
jgi:hypothetical protein